MASFWCNLTDERYFELRGLLKDSIRRQALLNYKLELIMSKISDYHDAVQTTFDAISAGLDGIGTDLQALADKITELQNSSGAITAADQALLDDIQAKAEALKVRVTDLDAKNVPPPPPAG
jgi:uncharacterized membrane-anchored protein YhcB (DUF1043 family)